MVLQPHHEEHHPLPQNPGPETGMHGSPSRVGMERQQVREACCKFRQDMKAGFVEGLDCWGNVAEREKH